MKKNLNSPLLLSIVAILLLSVTVKASIGAGKENLPANEIILTAM